MIRRGVLLLNRLARLNSHLPNMADTRGDDGQFELDVSLLLERVDFLLPIEPHIFRPDLQTFLIRGVVAAILSPLFGDFADIRVKFVPAKRALELFLEPREDTFAMELMHNNGRVLNFLRVSRVHG